MTSPIIRTRGDRVSSVDPNSKSQQQRFKLHTIWLSRSTGTHRNSLLSYSQLMWWPLGSVSSVCMSARVCTAGTPYIIYSLNWLWCLVYIDLAWYVVSCPASATLRTIYGTHQTFHTFRQEFRNLSVPMETLRFSHCNSEDRSVITEISYVCICLLFFPLCGFN